ncbi:6377_t:CDS:10 [Paraglomus occultum]|uniref:6377_t:CDS:1 n=1 Tax=Paraglomus occultum TaxID=144539 RepID=A0A9N8W3N7_9GLOM|nr:6377_t:CDS:10 [Paraglomus occultum]
MKFGKILAQESVPEWKKMYIDYNELKHILKEVIQSYKFADKEYHKNTESESPTSLGPAIDLNSALNDNLMHTSKKRLSDMTGSFFAKLSRRSTKTDIRSNANSSFCQSSIQDDMTMDEVIPMLNESEQKFFSKLDKELQKIWEFYGSHEDYASEKLRELKKAYKLLKHERKKGKSTGTKPDTFKPMKILKQVQVITADGQKKPVPMSYGVAKKRIKMGVMEFYRSLQMLKKYAQFNRLGFEKILKKYDKNTNWKVSHIYMRKVDAANFSNLKRLERILKQTESFYLASFSDGMRKHAIKRLRMPDKARSYYFVTWRVGVYLGMAINLTLMGIHSVMNRREFVNKNGIAHSCQINDDASLSPIEQQTFHNFCNYGLLLEIYAAVAAPIVLALLVGINMIVWAKAKINYKLIFDFDTRDNMDHREYLEFPSLLLLLLAICFYLSFANFFPSVPPLYFLVGFLIAVGLVFFCPFPILYYNVRRWLIVTMLRVCLPFVYGVEFRDFFLADELVSLQFTFSNVAILICALSSDSKEISDGKCSSNGNIWAVFMATVPAWIRFFQCLQRWVKTRKAHPHLLNALKYITIVIPLWILHVNTRDALVFWYLVHIFNTILANFWDMAMDWAFLRVWSAPNYGLREDLEFKPLWLYYVGIGSNTLMRLAWMTDQRHHISVMITLAITEVLRRFLWNFFRVEKEHVYNVLIKRAVKDINIPFVVTKNNHEPTVNHQVQVQLPSTRHESFVSRQTSIAPSHRFSFQHVGDTFGNALARFTPLYKSIDFRDYAAPSKNNHMYDIGGTSIDSDEDKEDDDYYYDEEEDTETDENTAEKAIHRQNSLRKLERVDGKDGPPFIIKRAFPSTDINSRRILEERIDVSSTGEDEEGNADNVDEKKRKFW